MKKLIMILSVFLLSITLFSCAGKDITVNEQDKNVTIYLVRHGKTIFNTTNQVQGWSDTPLTQTGVEGAKNVGKGLRDIKFTTAYSSDLGRAIATARYILTENKNGDIPLTELTGIREWYYGGFEGRDNSEMWDPVFEKYGLKFDNNWTQWSELSKILDDRGIANAIHNADPLKTAETYDQIEKRTKEAINTVVQQTLEKGGGNTLVVTHGSEISTILNIFAPGADTGTDIKNNSVSILYYKNGSYSVGIIGDNSYTEKGKKLR